MSDYYLKLDERHAIQVANGEHDDECEWGPRLMRNMFSEKIVESRIYMCHCAKRRRIAAGFTKPPGPLEHRSPDCPRCWTEVNFDGDSFVCENCCVSWGSDYGDEGTFADDYGDLGAPVLDEVQA